MGPRTFCISLSLEPLEGGSRRPFLHRPNAADSILDSTAPPRISEADTNGDASNTIVLTSGTYHLTAGELLIDDHPTGRPPTLTIIGSAASTSIDADGLFRVIEIVAAGDGADRPLRGSHDRGRPGK